MRYQRTHGVRVAVIQEDGSIPLHMTLDLASFLQGLGQSIPGVPDGAHPKVTYDGTIGVGGTSWLDPTAGRLVSTTSHADLDAHISYTGLPAGATAPDVSVTGGIALSLNERYPHAGKHTT